MRIQTGRVIERRKGAATVEFAVLAPILFTLIFGAIECGRAMMVLDSMANCARDGCRTGSLPASSNSDITAAVNAQLSSAGINSGATVSVTVNGQSVDASTAKKGDQISVTVSIQHDSVTWVPTSWFFGGKTLTRSNVMRRE
jgi:Flp pilus assembly protein TadG